MKDRITAEEIAAYEQRLAEEDITFDFVRGILDDLKSALSELDRLSARLEISPDHPYDGIATRETTILYLEKQIDGLQAKIAELLTAPVAEEVLKEDVTADLWAIHWSPGCWNLHESRKEAEAVARSGICELVPLWRSPAPPHPDTVAVSREYVELLENAANQFCLSCRDNESCTMSARLFGTGCGAWKLDGARINAIRAQAQPTTNETRG